MSTPRDARLTPGELALKHASEEAVRAAGGQTFVAGEVNRAQSLISDYCSPNTHEFMSIDIVRKVEALGAGSPGHPHITRALARAAGVPLGAPAAELLEAGNLGEMLAALTKEFGDLVGELAEEDLAARCNRLSPRSRADIGREAGELADKVLQLRAALEGCEGEVVPMPRRDSG